MPDEQVLKGAQGGLSKLAKILISAGAVTFLALVALAVFFICRSRKNKNTQEPGNVLSKEQQYQEELANPFKFIQAAPEGKNRKTIKSLLDGLSELSSPNGLSDGKKDSLWKNIFDCASKLGGIEAEDVVINFSYMDNEKNVVSVLNWMVKSIHNKYRCYKNNYNSVVGCAIKLYKANLISAKNGTLIYLDEYHTLERPKTALFDVSDSDDDFPSKIS